MLKNAEDPRFHFWPLQLKKLIEETLKSEWKINFFTLPFILSPKRSSPICAQFTIFWKLYFVTILGGKCIRRKSFLRKVHIQSKMYIKMLYQMTKVYTPFHAYIFLLNVHVKKMWIWKILNYSHFSYSYFPSGDPFRADSSGLHEQSLQVILLTTIHLAIIQKYNSTWGKKSDITRSVTHSCLQHPQSHMIKIWALDNWNVFTTVITSWSQAIVICDIPSWGSG